MREIPAEEMFPEMKLAREISEGWKESVGPNGESLSSLSAELKRLESMREPDEPGARIEHTRRQRDLMLLLEQPGIKDKLDALQAKNEELKKTRTEAELAQMGSEMAEEIKALSELGEEINRSHKEAQEMDVAA